MALLVLGLGTATAAALAQDAAVLPLESYTSAEARALAQVHAAELQALREDLRRCLPGLDVERHGIAFRRPRGSVADPPSLTLWVWLPASAPPSAADLPRRAGQAFRRYGQALVRQLVARSPVFADPRVGGYGLILTWLSPARRDGRLVGESIAVFAGKLATANFAHDTITADVFLSRAEVRGFDGEIEVGPLPLGPQDDGAPAVSETC